VIAADQVQPILEQAGYSVTYSHDIEQVIYFEDQSLLGFVALYPAAEDLVKRWQQQQDLFLQSHSESLRKDLQKSWNVYSVLLAADECPPTLQSKMIEIEEDFRATRKIVQAGVLSASDLIVALYPLLPIQALVSVQIQDLARRIRDKVDLSSEFMTDFFDAATAHDLAQLLLEE